MMSSRQGNQSQVSEFDGLPQIAVAEGELPMELESDSYLQSANVSEAFGQEGASQLPHGSRRGNPSKKSQAERKYRKPPASDQTSLKSGLSPGVVEAIQSVVNQSLQNSKMSGYAELTKRVCT